ncbi:septum formation protein Maf [Colwellia sp. 39_35_sub15_T18]|nr:septum formation protein Maf [Colwellia sp. 39_35_sub15_T18]
MKKLVLASQSPRRQALLNQLGYHFSILAADIDESAYIDEKPHDYVLRLAVQKAQAIFEQLPIHKQADTLVLGADTCVVNNGKILGKPEDEKQCLTTLGQLSGKSHQVLTSIAVVGANIVAKELITTQVNFKPLATTEIQRYWQTGEPCDKAGSYAIQGIGGQFVTSINGSYSAVVGLPLYETSQMLAKFGLPTSIQVNS